MTDLHVNIGDRGDRADRIYAQLRSAILDGRLRPGERVPSTRLFATRLTISRNTVAAAYERLIAEGYLATRVGAGTFVTAQRLVPTRRRAAPATGVRARPTWAVGHQSWSPPSPAAFDFSISTPDASLFPLESWRRLVTRSLRESAIGSGGYGHPTGNPRLRAAIARHIGVARSVLADTDDVIVTHGAQQAFDLIGRVLVEPGDVVAVESPGYPPVRRLYETSGSHVVGVPVDDEGLDVTALPPRARLIYVTPSHQFPLGSVMSLRRRMALLDWAQRHDAAIIEDDYDSEYRYENRPLEPLQSLDDTGRVVYVGTLSKTLLPALRLGFLVAPRSLGAALAEAKRLSDWQGEHATQSAAAAFIDGGLLARHVRKTNREYAIRRQLVIDTVRNEFADSLELLPSAAGLHVCTRLADQSIDAEDIAATAESLGVRVQSLRPFSDGEPEMSALAIGFGSIATEHIPDGLRLLNSALQRSLH